MAWTNSGLPGPVPPGPTDDIDESNARWKSWGDSIIGLAWQTYVFSSLGPPKKPYFRCEGNLGRRVPIPISGDNPSPWKADGGSWKGTFDVKVGPFEAGRELDFTRYRRDYPSVTFQDYQEVIVNVEYGWGDCSWMGHIIGPKNCIHRERTFTFWYPIGKPRKREKVRAYTWKLTSNKTEGGVSIEPVDDLGLAVTGDGYTFIPWNEGEDAPPEPGHNDFHPGHEKPPEGDKENGPFTGYGPISARIVPPTDLTALTGESREAFASLQHTALLGALESMILHQNLSLLEKRATEKFLAQEEKEQS